MAPTTPTAAASDGLAMPPYIEPITTKMRNNTGPRCFNPLSLSAQLAVGSSDRDSLSFMLERIARKPI